MPDCSGIDVLREAKALQPDLPGILMTAFSSTQTAIEALRTGALDYISKPFDIDEMKRVVAQALERRQLRDRGATADEGAASDDDGRPHASDSMIGRGPAMQRVFALIEAIAGTSSTVLITGESGTGKEMAARAIHRLSPRAERPFVALNCGALTETLLESELFGHEKGAFTGALHTKRGLIEQAEKGTIFLDELGEMSPLMQVKLLRVLQERRYRRVGGHEELAADIRIIAATNRDLAKMVADGHVPRGPVLPRQRDPGGPAGAARTARRHPGAGPALRAAVRARDAPAGRGAVGRGARRPHAPCVARQHPRARERARARCRPRDHRPRQARQPAGPPAGGRASGRQRRRCDAAPAASTSPSLPAPLFPTKASISSATSRTSSANTSPKPSAAPTA